MRSIKDIILQRNQNVKLRRVVREGRMEYFVGMEAPNKEFYGEDLAKYAKAFLREVPKGTKYLVSGSTAGNSIASAMLVLSETPLKHICIRKKHNLGMGTLYGHEVVVVDDLIISGKTMKRIIKVLKKEFGLIGYPTVLVLGVLNNPNKGFWVKGVNIYTKVELL